MPWVSPSLMEAVSISRRLNPAAKSPGAPLSKVEDERLLVTLDAYLCELKESQIRDGLHVFGVSPDGAQRTDTLAVYVRQPAPGVEVKGLPAGEPFEAEGETFLVEDLGSVNGTVVNDSVRLGPRQPRPLATGDRLRLGETTLHFLLG